MNTIQEIERESEQKLCLPIENGGFLATDLIGDWILDKQSIRSFLRDSLRKVRQSTLDEVIEKAEGMKKKGEYVPAPCPDNNPGCCVYHQTYIETPEIKRHNLTLSDLITSLKQ